MLISHLPVVLAGKNSTTYSSVTNTVNAAVIDGKETYCYNERNELTERKTLSAITEYLYDENRSLVREKEGSIRQSATSMTC